MSVSHISNYKLFVVTVDRHRYRILVPTCKQTLFASPIVVHGNDSTYWYNSLEDCQQSVSPKLFAMIEKCIVDSDF